MTTVRLCFHDRCFDGAASAALFYRFYREQFDPKAEFHLRGMTHKAKHPWEDALFDGDENVIVDFKYSNSPKVTWWFDHHQSAFLTPADAEHFKRFPGQHMYYEPDYKSCTKLIATVTGEKFGFNTKPLADLIHWGDIIDGAQFPSAQFATELSEPATQLALVIEAAPEDGVPAQIIPELAYRPLSEIVQLPVVAKYLGPLLERHRKSIEILRQRCESKDGVIFFDVSDLDMEGYNKFIPYLLHPEGVYSVSVSASPVRAKVSLGTNPWNQATADKNLATLAEQYGGGGHQRVSAISFDPQDLQRARKVARDLAAVLRAK
ncbi:MAG TPA: DHH family phosphoesterase [Candidatus Sulfotelmatobacter sp.]|nr:DHH family phosphoesterase [Candidatus Sulfotelmatobacter sp.]